MTMTIVPASEGRSVRVAKGQKITVRTPKGFREAYQLYVESGWNALPFDPDFGGQGLPWTLALDDPLPAHVEA